MVCLRKSARSAGDTGFSFVLIDRVLLRVILSQIAQITQRNTASCIISQRKTGCLRLRLFCGLSAIICVISERHWGFICADRLSTLACYSPADYADYAEECGRLHYIAEKDRLFEAVAVIVVLLIWVLSA